jgi:hypothetical protein
LRASDRIQRGIRGWSITRVGTRGIRNDAVAVYMSGPTCAIAFVARWCVPGDPPGFYEFRPDEPERRVPAPHHKNAIIPERRRASLNSNVNLTGVSATAQSGTFSETGIPGPRTFFIGSTIQQVIAPGMQMYPTSDTIDLGSSPYILGSSQFYSIGLVVWNGAAKVEGTDWRPVSPFSHIIEILNLPAEGTPITLRYVRWNIQVTEGFTVTSYPAPFSFINTTIVAEEVPPVGQFFHVSFAVNRIANNPQTLFSIFPVMVDDMLADHTIYDGSKGFQTYRPRCYQMLDTSLMQIFEWTGSSWIAISDVANGTSFYVKSLRAIYQNDAGVAVLKYTAGDGPSDSYSQAITYPPFGEGIGKNLLVDGFSADAPTQYPAAYQVCSTPGTYDSVCEDKGFDNDFGFSFD